MNDLVTKSYAIGFDEDWQKRDDLYAILTLMYKTGHYYSVARVENDEFYPDHVFAYSPLEALLKFKTQGGEQYTIDDFVEVEKAKAVFIVQRNSDYYRTYFKIV